MALAFGNETRGVSRALRRHADIRFWLPTTGFTQSLNLSVATGASLAVVSSLDDLDAGATGDAAAGRGIPKEEQEALLAKWLLRDFGRGVDAFLRRQNLERPDDF